MLSDSFSRWRSDDSARTAILDPMRQDGRPNDQLRAISITREFTTTPAGSVLWKQGGTVVLCTASITPSVPPWFKPDRAGGWLTADYVMLPGSTPQRKDWPKLGHTDSRGTEIQRLIGRAIRAVVDLSKIGPHTIHLDCQVLQADGGTRTASITGAFVALVEACSTFYEKGKVFPVKDFLAAISVGISHEEDPILDLCYEEDSQAIVDMNVVMTGAGKFVEVQGTGEGRPFSHEELGQLLQLGEKGCRELISYQKDILGGELVWLVGREG